MVSASRPGATPDTGLPQDAVTPTGTTQRRSAPRPRTAVPDEAERTDPAAESSAAEGDAAPIDDARSDVNNDTGEPETATTTTIRPTLTDRERAMLAFERSWWRHAGSKEQAIRETFELSATHYYRLLNALLDVPAAAEFDPLVVGRLRRLRASRARRRTRR